MIDQSFREKKSDSVPESLIWFPDKDDKSIWDSFVGEEKKNGFILGEGSEKISFKITNEENEFNLNDHYTARIVCLPDTGLSDRIFTRIKVDFAFRIFHKDEFDTFTSQKMSPVETIWRQVSQRKEIERRPLFLFRDDKNAEALQSWFLKIKDIIVTQNKHKDYSNEAAVILTRIEKVLRCKRSFKIVENSQKINSIDEFKYYLFVNQIGRGYLEQIDENEKIEKKLEEKISNSKSELDYLCIENYEKIIKKINKNSDYAWNISDDLAPEIRELIENTKLFAEKLIKENKDNELADIGENLKVNLSLKPPALALLGSFSSGKTTLLNALLFSGAQDWKNFRTSTVANTAIISEIAFANDGKEEALFDFHERIDHKILSPTNDEDYRPYELTRTENIECLIHLIDKEILKGSTLIISSKKKKKEIINQDKHIIRFLKAILRSVEDNRPLKNIQSIEFNADVKRDKIKSENIPERIDLTKEEGWRKLNPSDKGDLCIENELSSFLIKKAEIKLKNPLLKLTTIADTPGTGSWNDRHDIITERYINVAENYILLLPTKTAGATRVKKIIDRLAEEARKKESQSSVSRLSMISFVVNCFSTHEISDRRKKVEEFEDYIKESFGISEEEWERERGKCFFAVNLREMCKGVNANELYGYNSIAHLRGWFNTSFRRGAYKIRLEKIQRILDHDWKKSMNSLGKSITELESSNDVKNRIISSIKEFYKPGIDLKSKEILTKYEGYKEDMGQCKKNIMASLNDFVKHPKNEEDIRQCHENLKSCYSEVDIVIKSIKDIDPLGDWISWTKEELGKLNISPPPIYPVRCDEWSPNLSLSKESLNQRVKSIKDRWPSNIVTRGWESFKGLFSNSYDKRVVMAEELKEYCMAQLGSVEKPMTKYISLCRLFIEDNTKEITSRCEKKISEIESDVNIDKKRQEKKSVLVLFKKYDSERSKLIKTYENEINKRSSI